MEIFEAHVKCDITQKKRGAKTAPQRDHFLVRRMSEGVQSTRATHGTPTNPKLKKKKKTGNTNLKRLWLT